MAIRKVSEKRLRANGGKMYSSISKKPTRIKKRPRSKSEFARIYGSKQRVEFVKTLSCAACGLTGFSANAHLTPKGEKGTGFKGSYRFIAPLCETLPTPYPSISISFSVGGCHKLFDRYRSVFNAEFPDFDPAKAAAETEKLWQSHIAAPEKEK